MLSPKKNIPSHDFIFITLDTLRYDVAMELWNQGMLPELSSLMPERGWEARHTPGSFTYSAHAAFFAGFFPTPAAPGKHARPFAVNFPGSESISDKTLVFDAPNIVSGFADMGYHTMCVGGVGFFNKLSPLGNVFPAMFEESHWREDLGVTCRESTGNQVDLAMERINFLAPEQPLFLFLNVSAIHQPNRIFCEGADRDGLETHGAALRYVDGHLGRLFRYLKKRRPVHAIICSDHGTAYGDGGYHGHRCAHECVWTVPYTEFLL